MKNGTKHVMTSSGEELVLGLIHTKGDGRLVAREPVTHSDLLLSRDETWLKGLRTGVLGPDLARIVMQVLPGENHGDRLIDYTIELNDNGRSFRKSFTIHSLYSVGRRAALSLLKQGEELKEDALDKDGDFAFYLTTVRPEAEPEGEPQPKDEFRVVRKSEIPFFEPASLADYLANSEVLTGASEPTEEKTTSDFPPVFVTQEVWDEGHEMARAGGEKESAAVWTGRLMRDTRSSEIFLVLDACIKAEHASEEKFKVTFSGETWAQVRKLLDLRRQRLNRPHERIIGSVHGHNFMPGADAEGKRTCAACSVVKICTRTTASASIDDLDWHRSVFVGQPWALLLVWGYNAREHEDWRLYGLEDATLTPRTIRLLKS